MLLATSAVIAADLALAPNDTTATDLLIIATAASTGRSLFYTLDQRQGRLAKGIGVATAPS